MPATPAAAPKAKKGTAKKMAKIRRQVFRNPPAAKFTWMACESTPELSHVCGLLRRVAAGDDRRQCQFCGGVLTVVDL